MAVLKFGGSAFSTVVASMLLPTLPAGAAPPPEAKIATGLDDATIAALSASYVQSIGHSIGTVREAKFLDEGRHVVILDRFTPYLRLFSGDGTFLWAGGFKGGGPDELQDPQSIATQGRTLVVAQLGRLSRWRLEGDPEGLQNGSTPPVELSRSGEDL